jgi:hypothetical protein
VPRKLLDSLRDFKPLVTNFVAVLGLVVAVLALTNGCREIDQQRDALVTERHTREREIDILQRQTRLSGSSLRPVIVPDDPVIRAFQTLPNGSARMNVALVNLSGSLALRGRLLVIAWDCCAVPSLRFDLLNRPGWRPFEQQPRVGSFDALRGGGRIMLDVTAPASVLNEVKARPRTRMMFVLTYRDIADRLSLTDWAVDVLQGGRRAINLQITTKNR